MILSPLNLHLEPVYIDALMTAPISANWRWPKACHMFVDTRVDIERLHSFAESIGLRRAWFQNDRWPHYDLNPSRRIKAVRAGAIELDRRSAVMVMRRWKEMYRVNGGIA